MSKKISGRDLANAAFDDIESFFIEETKFRVNRELDTNAILHASCKGKGEKTRICLSKFFCDNQICTFSDFLTSLLVISHELAHYLNYHNEHSDRPDSKDKVAIEARADNFSAIIMHTILFFGDRTISLAKELRDGNGFNYLQTATGKAIRQVHDSFYKTNTSSNYPNATYRVYSVVAGGISFYYRWCIFYNKLDPEMIRRTALTYALNVMRGGKLTELNNSASAIDNTGEIQGAIFEIHANLQRNHIFMNSGLKQTPGFFLTSNFQKTEDERRAYQEYLEELIGMKEFASQTTYK